MINFAGNLHIICMFLGLDIFAWITIATILGMFIIMICTKLPADFVFLGGMGVLYVTGVLSMSEALAGFSSNSVVTIGVLFVVIAGLVHTGVLQWIVKYLLGIPRSYSKAIVRLMLPVAGLSAFLSNTTVVALFINVVKIWSKKLKVAPSRLLIPLSYASCMGGICTLIGTPPNLIVSGISRSYFFSKNYYPNVNHPTNLLKPPIAILWKCWFRQNAPPLERPSPKQDSWT